MSASRCLLWHVDCGTLVKGAGVVLAAFTLFVGSIFLLLTFVVGRWMAYLVLVIAFSGWMIIQSALWLFGFWSQGPGTPTNLGPRGTEPAWVVLQGGLSPAAARFPAFASYPNGPWNEANPGQTASVQGVSGTAQTFLAEQANEELGISLTDAEAIQSTQIVVDDVKFAPSGKTSLAVVQAHYAGGGPLVTLSMYHDPGSVPRYSYMFLFGSIVLFALHLPLLDRAEKRRKAFLTGGTSPPWYGPA